MVGSTTPTLRPRSKLAIEGETFHIEALRGEGGFAKVIFKKKSLLTACTIFSRLTFPSKGLQCYMARRRRGALCVEGGKYYYNKNRISFEFLP